MNYGKCHSLWTMKNVILYELRKISFSMNNQKVSFFMNYAKKWHYFDQVHFISML